MDIHCLRTEIDAKFVLMPSRIVRPLNCSENIVLGNIALYGADVAFGKVYKCVTSGRFARCPVFRMLRFLVSQPKFLELRKSKLLRDLRVVPLRNNRPSTIENISCRSWTRVCEINRALMPACCIRELAKLWGVPDSVAARVHRRFSNPDRRV